MKKVSMYVDGFNFYYGIKKHLFPKGLIGLGWCDFRKLAERYLQPDEKLDKIRYFTAPVTYHLAHSGEQRKQALWLDAVRTIEGLTVVEGFYTGTTRYDRKEKMTDVNIAVEMIFDAHGPNAPDKAIIVSSDLDMFPVAEAIKTRIEKVSVEFLLHPGGREYTHLKMRCCEADIPCREITKDKLFYSMLPERIEHNGRTIDIDPEWIVSKSIARSYGWV